MSFWDGQLVLGRVSVTRVEYRIIQCTCVKLYMYICMCVYLYIYTYIYSCFCLTSRCIHLLVIISSVLSVPPPKDHLQAELILKSAGDQPSRLFQRALLRWLHWEYIPQHCSPAGQILQTPLGVSHQIWAIQTRPPPACLGSQGDAKRKVIQYFGRRVLLQISGAVHTFYVFLFSIECILT